MKTREDAAAAPMCKTTFPPAGTSSVLSPWTEASPAADRCDLLLPPHCETEALATVYNKHTIQGLELQNQASQAPRAMA